MTLYQIPSSHVDWSKNMAARGWGYSENLKNLLLQKCQTILQKICRNVPWPTTLYQIPSSHVDWP